MVVIDPNSVWTPSQLREKLGLPESSVTREIRKGRLKAHLRCRKYFVVGKEVMAWIESGGLKPDRRRAAKPVKAMAGAG